MSIYELGENYTLINKTPEITKTILKNNMYTVTYSVTGSMLPMTEHDLLKENIFFRAMRFNRSYISRRTNFRDIFKSFRKKLNI